VLGRGGMGSVYEVRHLDTGHVRAMKVLSTRVAEHPELAERVEREAQFLKMLDGTPYIVTVVEGGRLPDQYRRPYLVMERLHGATLRQVLRQSLPLTDALSYTRQLLVALALVHQAGVVHRDVKPDNLFVRRDGTCTLLDFSVMKALYDIGLSPNQFSTAPRAIIGTPLYLAPERLFNKALCFALLRHREASGHNTTHRDVHPRLGRVGLTLEIFGEPSLPVPPPERPLHHPTTRQQDKPFRIVRTFHDFKIERGCGRVRVKRFGSKPTIDP
jgi:serine/threonine protein kinase